MAELTTAQRRAVALAKAKARARKSKAGGSGVMANVNRGIVDAAGGLADFINPFDQPHSLNPFPQGTGSAQAGMTNLMQGAGINVAQGDPQTVLEGAARGLGQASGAAIPASLTARGLSTAGGMLGNIADDAYRGLTSILGVGAEAAGGAISGAAEEAAEQQGAPEWAQNMAAVAAPMAVPAAGLAARGAGRAATYLPVVNIASRAAGSAGRAIAREAAPYTKTGAQEVAGQRMQQLAGGPERAEQLAAQVGGDNPLRLTPAQQTGDENMFALEQLAGSQNPNIRERLDGRATESRGAFVEGVEQPGDIQDTRAFFETRRRDYSADLRRRAEEAIGQTTRDVENIGPQRTESENSLQVSNRLNEALNDAKTQEKALWDRVPMTMTVPTDQSRQTLATWADRFGPVGMENIPPAAQRWLGDQGLGDEASVRDMHQLYSSLRETARGARAGTKPKPRLAAAADSIADAILDDLGASANIGEAGRTINEARAFSRAMHETFDRGAVGRLMKRTIDGDTSIDSELALRRTVGRSGAEGMVGSRQIEEGISFGGRYTDADPHITDYIKDRFQQATITPTGDFNNRSAQKFLRDNRELLDRYPELRDDVTEAVQARDGADAFAQRIEGRIKRLEDARLSAGAALLDGPPQAALRAFTEARNPVRAARLLANEARKDPSGQALSGLKSLLSRELIAKSGETGTGFLKAMENPKLKAGLRQIFTEPEMSRMRRLARELDKLDRSQTDAPSIGTSLSGASPNQFVETVARIKAAQLGGSMSSGGNMGGSLQTANILSSRVRDVLGRLTADRASQMLADAVEDPELFKLLLSGPTSIKDEKKARNLILPYLIGGASAAAAQ